MIQRSEYTEILDTREDGLRCVRFESGQVGVVDEHGDVILQFDRCKEIEFVEHDFVRVRFFLSEVTRNPMLRNAPKDNASIYNTVFYADMKSGQMYGNMPQIICKGEFELAYLREFLCTRTRKCFMMEEDPEFITVSPNGLYLPLSYNGQPVDENLKDLLHWYKVYRVCQLKGDDSKVYWLLREYKDDSVLVMDEQGLHIYVWMDWKTGKVTRQELGYMRNEAERALMTLMLNDIKREAETRYAEKKATKKKEAEKIRRKEMKALVDVEPFQIGGKWGLKQGGRIVVPPMYRTIQKPVGKYCAVESYPGIWGVIAVDGIVEIEPKYDGVEIKPDGTAELTIFGGKKKRVNL